MANGTNIKMLMIREIITEDYENNMVEGDAGVDGQID